MKTIRLFITLYSTQNTPHVMCSTCYLTRTETIKESCQSQTSRGQYWTHKHCSTGGPKPVGNWKSASWSGLICRYWLGPLHIWWGRMHKCSYVKQQKQHDQWKCMLPWKYITKIAMHIYFIYFIYFIFYLSTVLSIFY